ncbi:hypothetical protein [Nisaea sp.]|uniref:hypothetical protein n=1 Tax=Nisaea sp. TaxID=2024842 RepID=UPI002B278C0C|nr:hypothetical protein [Nisaea sp.]
MQFDILRLSLLHTTQIDLEERRLSDGSEFDRETWLQDVFSQQIQFIHRKEIFHFVPIVDQDDSFPGLIAGRIGRLVKVQENEPPERGLTETEREAWHASLVLIDPTHHGDGQKVAFQKDSSIGTPLRLLESLANKINNSGISEPFFIEVAPVADLQTFWDFTKKNEGKVTAVTFEFLAPNMFGIHDDYDQEMANLRDNEKIRRAKLQIESEEGLELDTDRVRFAANYTTRGGGSLKARTSDGKTYDSNKKIERVKLGLGDMLELSIGEVINHAANVIFRR